MAGIAVDANHRNANSSSRSLTTAAPVFMARVAIHAVVDVTRNALVIRVGGGLCMAIRAGEDGIVVRISMACRADTIRAAVIHVPPSVVEGGAEPVCGDPRGVARGARRRETGGSMIRICGARVVGFVAGIAIGGSAGINVSDMAAQTWDAHVRALQGEWRAVVVERCSQPIRRSPGCMAQRAVLRKPRGHMVRNAREIARVVVVRRMASVATGRQSAGVVVGMARSARNRGVRTL